MQRIDVSLIYIFTASPTHGCCPFQKPPDPARSASSPNTTVEISQRTAARLLLKPPDQDFSEKPCSQGFSHQPNRLYRQRVKMVPFCVLWWLVLCFAWISTSFGSSSVVMVVVGIVWVSPENFPGAPEKKTTIWLLVFTVPHPG
jgi:hypothetical protein